MSDRGAPTKPVIISVRRTDGGHRVWDEFLFRVSGDARGPWGHVPGGASSPRQQEPLRKIFHQGNHDSSTNSTRKLACKPMDGHIQYFFLFLTHPCGVLVFVNYRLLFAGFRHLSGDHIYDFFHPVEGDSTLGEDFFCSRVVDHVDPFILEHF